MKSILLLHGALGSKEQMVPLANILTNTYDVYTLDFSGHGKKSNVDYEFSIERMAIELDACINDNQIEAPNVFGYSMGGYVALYHGFLFPGKIKKIITLATKFDWSMETSEKEVKQLDIEMMKEKIPDFINALKQRHGEHWEKVVLRTATMMLELGKSKPINETNLPQINTDAMLCIGDRDKMVSLVETEHTANLLPNGILKVMTDTPHPFERVSYEKLREELMNHIGT